MAPTKESDTLPTVIEKPLAAGESGRAQPVALEVPVTVNGARAIEGSDRREPFSETTQTVLVFGHGAVIRLASAVVSGQLLFLTNEKSKKEVVCQVVKSKNYRNVTGYVELEFTEAIPGFWGMRFPNERVSHVPASQATPVSPVAASGSPVSPKAAPVVASSASSASEVKASAPVLESHEMLTTDALRTAKPSASLTLPHTLEVKSGQHQPKISVPNEPSWTSSIPHALETKSPLPSAVKSNPLQVAGTSPAQINNTEPKLPLTERLSVLEQKLKTPLAAGLPAAPVAKKPAAELASKVVEIAKADVPNLKAVAKKTAPVAPSLDVEEVKIPSWLEPLARNSAAHNVQEVSGKEETPEVAEIEVIQHATEHRHTEVHHTEVSLPTASSSSPAQDVAASLAPKPLNFPVQTETLPAESKTGSGKNGTVIGAIAAGILLLLVGGAWYARRPSTQSATPAPSVAASAAQPSAAQAGLQTSNPASVLQGSDATPQGNIPTGTATAQTVRSVDKSYAAQELAAYKKLAEPEPKKPTIGEVHLANPTLSRGALHADNTLDSAPSLADAPARNVSGTSLIASNSMQPAAPVAPIPVGGDVKTARLVSTVPPVYPSLARSQRISGDVRVEALIDASGKVSTMKVISGPTLLHQAAMDSLRQWKYQPATLNGTPVPMRLTATVQFHLQ